MPYSVRRSFDKMNGRPSPVKSISYESSWNWSCDSDGKEATGSEGPVKYLPHAHRLILEYKQFKAAQLIQRYVRGWLVRSHMRKILLAAVVIQKWWRRFMAQRILFDLAESKLQLAVISNYNSSAILIQRTFRGWWTRRHVNDMTKLKSLQESQVESIISSLATYLHELKRNGQLPGVHFEHLPKECLETIDHLMSTLDYRIFNAFSCYRMQKALTEVSGMRTAFKNSTYYTHGPFSGFEAKEVSQTRASPPTVEEDGPENAHLIRSFVCRKHDMDQKTKFARKAADEGAHKSMKLALDGTITAFLKRILIDMKKWQDDDGKKKLPRNISNVADINQLLEAVKLNVEHSRSCGCQFADM